MNTVLCTIYPVPYKIKHGRTLPGTRLKLLWGWYKLVIT